MKTSDSLNRVVAIGPHDISDLNICHRVKFIRETEVIAAPGDPLVLAVVGTTAIVVEHTSKHSAALRWLWMASKPSSSPVPAM